MAHREFAERPARILMMEDNHNQARLMEEALTEAELTIELTVVPDGMEGLKFLRRQGVYVSASRPDLILVDLNMPKMNGHEVLLEVKSDIDLRQIPVLVLSSSRAESDIQRAYDLHANGYIVKPRSWDAMVALVRAINDFWLQNVVLRSADTDRSRGDRPQSVPPNGTGARFA